MSLSVCHVLLGAIASLLVISQLTSASSSSQDNTQLQSAIRKRIFCNFYGCGSKRSSPNSLLLQKLKKALPSDADDGLLLPEAQYAEFPENVGVDVAEEEALPSWNADQVMRVLRILESPRSWEKAQKSIRK